MPAANILGRAADHFLESTSGKTGFRQRGISTISGQWKSMKPRSKSGDVKASKGESLRHYVHQALRAVDWLQNVSLFPPTYNNRPNGTRPDIMQLLGRHEAEILAVSRWQLC